MRNYPESREPAHECVCVSMRGVCVCVCNLAHPLSLSFSGAIVLRISFIYSLLKAIPQLLSLWAVIPAFPESPQNSGPQVTQKCSPSSLWSSSSSFDSAKTVGGKATHICFW